MSKLVLKRKKDVVTVGGNQYFRIRASEGTYNKVVEVAEETGMNLREVIDKMIDYAYANTVFESEDE